MSLSHSSVTSLIAALCLLWSVAPAYAKRAAPRIVEPVVIGSVRYSAPSKPEFMGFVVATDATSGKELWRKRIYRVFINPSLEADVQWVFITSLVQQGHTLTITNERGARFRLDLATREVTKSK